MHAWFYGICSLCQVCRGSCVRIRSPRLLVVHVVVSAKKKTHLDLFFGRTNWLIVAWLSKDSSLKKCVLVVVTYFLLTCVTVVGVDYASRLNKKCVEELVVIPYTLSAMSGRCKTHLVWPHGLQKEVYNLRWLLSVH